MEIYGVRFSKGALGKNNGCERAVDEIVRVLKIGGVGAREIAVFQDNIEKTNVSIFNAVCEIKGKAIVVGGDHSITYSCFKGFASRVRNAGIIVFDAHPDVYSDFKVSHEDYLRALIEEGVLDASRVVIIGLRSICGEEAEYLARKRIVYFDMVKIFEFGISEVCDMVMERAVGWGGVYVSIDIDAVDPAFAPGIGYIEPGGLSSRELLYFISRLKRMRGFGMCDIVEINPEKDINNLTVMLGVKIIGELRNETFYSC